MSGRRLLNTQAASKIWEQWIRKTFRKDIGLLITGRNMKNSHLTCSDHVSRLDRIGRHIDRNNIDTKDNSFRSERFVKLTKKITQRVCFSYDISNATILSLSTRTRNRVLSFRRPGKKICPEKHTIARSRHSRTRTTTPISIRVSCKLTSRRRIKL